MQPQYLALDANGTSVRRSQFAGALSAYTSKFGFQRFSADVSGSDATLTIPADTTRVGLVISGSDNTVTVDSGGQSNVFIGPGVGIPLGSPLYLDKGSDYDIVASQQQWIISIPAGKTAKAFAVYALPVGC